MEKILNIEEFFEQHIQKGVNNTHSNYLDTALKFNKYHIEKVLNIANKIAIDYDCDGNYNNEILTCYPLEKIK
jgi:hypothetical protein